MSTPKMKIPTNKQGDTFHGKKYSNQKGFDGSSLLSSECPFTILGISKYGASKNEVLKAWRQKMKVFHSDKTGDGDDTAAKILNDAKERALKDVKGKSTSVGDKAQQEFEEASGIKVDEDRMELLHRIMTGQTELGDGSTQPERSDLPEKWMDKDVFKTDIFRMMSNGLDRY
jgi:DnaJ-class molecular chaperone